MRLKVLIVDGVVAPNAELVNAFRARIGEADVRGCQQWLAGVDSSGYGTIMCQGKKYPAHRLAWMLHHDKIVPQNLEVCHSCDNPPCVSPKHLWLGTKLENQRDSVRKGRRIANAVRGTAQWCAKLDYERASEIRFLYTHCFKVAWLASAYDVSTKTIHNIINGKIWNPKPGRISPPAAEY